jgi:hypothetical protein
MHYRFWEYDNGDEMGIEKNGALWREARAQKGL